MKFRHILLSAIILAAPQADAQTFSTSLRGVASANRKATAQPAAQGFINAIQVYPFADGAIFQAYTAPGSVTDIALQPGEALVAVASGDTTRWVIGNTTSGGEGSGDKEAKRTHILVKPFAAGLTTNLVITTSRRTYHLRLASTSATAMAGISWTYPQDDLIALRRQADAARAAEPVASALDIAQLHFDYAISGDRPSWRPLRAFDDGLRTYIEFPPALAQGDAPPLFVLGPDGKAELVNYRLRDRYYVVDRLFGAAELRLGLKKQEVVRITRIESTKRRRGA
jgi:type IV secretion system protein TrbG